MRRKGEYYVNRHSCFLLQYHLVLVTKFRKKILIGECRERLIKLIQKFFEERGNFILEMEVCADHVHVLFDAPPTENLAAMVNILKTSTARVMRREFREHLSSFYWKPLFWSDSYFVATVSERSEAAVKQYIASQDITS